MAATPFTGVLITKLPNGARGPSFRFTANDVALADVIFLDLGSTQVNLTVPAGGLVFDDLLLSAAGVDTKALQLRKGVALTDKILRDAAMVETLSVDASSRTQGLRGAFFEPGAQYGLRQIA